MDDIDNILARIPNWVRWPLVPLTVAVTAAVVLVLANIAAHLFVFLDAGRSWGLNFFQYLLNPALSTYFSVVFGVAMAPRFKELTALFVGIFWFFGSGFLTLFNLLTETWPALISAASMCVGSGIAAMSGFSEPKEQYVDLER